MFVRVSTVTAVSTILLLGAAPVPAAAQPPAIYFSESFDAGLDAWWAEPGWSTTDNRAASGLSAYFGDDKGTPQPEDNDMAFCEGTLCAHELRSPVFTLPEGPAFLYLWMYADLFDDSWNAEFTVAVERIALEQRVPVATPALYPGWIVQADLGAFAGEAVRLVFTAYPGHTHPGEEGIYLDEVVVTDLFVPTEKRVHAQAPGPAAAVSFRPDPDVRALIKITIEGQYVGPTTAFLSAIEHQGVAKPYSGSVAGGGVWLHGNLSTEDPQNMTFGAGAGASLQVLRLRLVDHDIEITNSPSGSARLTATLRVSLMDPETTGFAVALLGIANGTATTTLIQQSPETSYGAAHGGEQLALAFPGAFEAAFVATAAEALIAMVDGELVRTASGPSLGWFPAAAMHLEGLSISSPAGPLGSSRFAYASSDGDWRVSVASAANTADWPFPWAIIARVPPFPTPASVEGPDLSGIPPAAAASGSAGAQQERLWHVAGAMACQVAAAGVATPAGCHMHPLFWSHDTFRIASHADLRSIGFAIRSPASWLGPHDVTDMLNGYCLRLVSPPEVASEACARGGETVTLIGSPGGGPLLADAEVLQFQVVVDDPGLAFVEVWQLDLALHYG